ncbi:hypothetical protein ACWEIJ_25405 [Lentzea sp. NPDC004789]
MTGALAAPPSASAAEADAAAPCVQKVAVVNNAGFVLSFRVTTRTGGLSPETDNYPINQWRVVDLTATELAEGSDVRPLVQAVGGTSQTGNTFVSYCRNGQTATYTASGATLNYTVVLIN